VNESRPAILATASCLPDTVRGNDDPIFDWLHSHLPTGSNLFEGYNERRVLATGEDLVGLMQAAADSAMQRASLSAAAIDLLVGYSSISAWEMPNDLFVLAKRLGLAPTTTIIPINNEYANFNQSLVVADALISAGRASKALVVVGADWSRYVDYHTAPAISAADGVGAAVVGMSDDPTLFRVRDVATDSDPQYLGGMYVSADPTQPPIVPPTFEAPVFHLNQMGIEAFQTFGVHRPPSLAQEVLSRNALQPSDVAFVGHQTSTVLNDAWQSALQPAQFIQTLATYANMTSASIPVNFDVCADQITTAHVVLVALGPEPSCNVVLLERQPAKPRG
jgi:3-oxoacyl-[acyl-carrier-protein] synthase III